MVGLKQVAQSIIVQGIDSYDPKNTDVSQERRPNRLCQELDAVSAVAELLMTRIFL